MIVTQTLKLNGKRGGLYMRKVLISLLAILFVVANLGISSVDANNKTVSRIVIPTTYAKQDSGHARILKLDVVYSDGSVERITKGVTWSSTTKKVARVGKETVIAGVPGKSTLTATYKGKKASRVMAVSIPSKQSDVNWLKLQQASIFYDGNFYGNSVKLGEDIRKVEGLSGAYGIVESGSGLFGKWSGHFLVSNTTEEKINPSTDIVSIVTTPKLFKRTITYKEVESAFGPASTIFTADEDGYGFTVGFFKNGKSLYEFKQNTLLSYKFNKRVIDIEFDDKQIVRAITIY